MPELPEVEVLVRHLGPLLQDKAIRAVRVHRARIVEPASTRQFARGLRGARFCGLSRRGKYLLFTLKPARRSEPLLMVGHLGMTGRMYLLPAGTPLPKHTAVSLDLGRENFVFEDTRYFGRLTLEAAAIEKLGPEPLGVEFTPQAFAQRLQSSRQPIKVKLLDQSVVAGVGNIYASEALFRAGVAPQLPARKLTPRQIKRLCKAVREVLTEAIAWGSTVPLNYAGVGSQERLFYFGRAPGAPDYYQERLRVYDRANSPCPKCGGVIKRLVQAGRSTYYCARCQRWQWERNSD
jgi:formamidopyrimidine-DNA glycosylase